MVRTQIQTRVLSISEINCKMITSKRRSIITIRSADEDSQFSELLHLDTIPTDRKDYLFSPKEFDGDWFNEWKEYIFTLSTSELILTPFDGSYNFKLLNISMLHVLEDHLIFGKIVGDALGLHPALGAMPNPTGGIVGSNNSNFILRSLAILPSFRKNGIIHDATGYLRYYHGIGPGYRFLDTGDIRGRLTPTNGMFYGFKLPKANLKKYLKWKMIDVMNTIEEIEGKI